MRHLILSFAILATAATALVVAPPAAAEDLVAVATDFQFLPAVLVVPSGSTVTWVEGTAAFLPHSVTAAGLFDLDPGAVGPGGTIGSVTFDQPSGTVVEYFCKPHAALGMRGFVVVV